MSKKKNPKSNATRRQNMSSLVSQKSNPVIASPLVSSQEPENSDSSSFSEASQNEIHQAMKEGAFAPYFDVLEDQDTPLLNEESTSQSTSQSVLAVEVVSPSVEERKKPSVQPESNMTEDPFAAYKAPGKWITFWMYAPKGFNKAEWETQAGNLHFSCSLDLHSVVFPWPSKTNKPRFAKIVYQVGYDPYPDLNTNIQKMSKPKAKNICEKLTRKHFSNTKTLWIGIKNVKHRVRYWGESWPNCIQRLVAPHINRQSVSQWFYNMVDNLTFNHTNFISKWVRLKVCKWTYPHRVVLNNKSIEWAEEIKL